LFFFTPGIIDQYVALKEEKEDKEGLGDNERPAR
jgi:hypothetical protein